MTVHNRDLCPLHSRRIEQVELADLLGGAFQLFRAGLGDRFGQRLPRAGFSHMLGTRPLAALGEDDLRAMADRIYPTNPAASKNREIIGPAHSVLHYAAAQGWIAKRTGTLLT
jgi:hypothetical protein